MIVVLSGEGPSDLGQCSNAQDECSHPDLSFGPMSIIVDMIIEECLGYSIRDTTPERYIYVNKARLKSVAKDRQSVVLRGRHAKPETAYFRVNAQALGIEALRIEQNFGGDKAIAILFRDTDGTRSTQKNLWETKFSSMEMGFQQSGLGIRGVPMLPKPKSEAWMLCAVKDNPYQNCGALEDLSGNDNAPNSAKEQLCDALGGDGSTMAQVRWIDDNGFDHAQVSSQMPSFGAFKQRLIDAVDAVRQCACGSGATPQH